MINANSMTARRRLFWFLPLLLVWFVAAAPAGAVSFTNAAPVTIPASGPANVYPSTINVSGLTGEVVSVSVRLNHLSHTRPDDLDILLVGPDGESVLLMSDAGGGGDISNVLLTFADGARTDLTDSGQIVSGTFQPANFNTHFDTDAFPRPAPSGPYGSALSVFRSTDPNGSWDLFIVDDTSSASGLLADGWQITLTVTNIPPAITTPPQSLTVLAGGNVAFSVAATGTAPLNYRWQKNSADIPGANGPTFALKSVDETDAGDYRVLVSNSAGTATSSLATLRVLVPPVITMQPQDVAVLPGGTATFRVVVTGTPPFGFAWRHDDGLLVPFSQGTAMLTIPNVKLEDLGMYSVSVTNPATATGAVASRTATLSLLGPPLLAVQPVSVTPNVGDPFVRFNVTGAGTPPLRYQWRLNGANLPGENGPSLMLSNVQPAHGGSYSVVVFNDEGALPSMPATLVPISISSTPAGQDDFVERATLLGVSGGVRGDSRDATQESGEPLHAGKPGGHSVWYEFYAVGDGIVTFDTHGSTFDTLLAVYTGSALKSLVEVTSNDDNGPGYTSQVRFNVHRTERYAVAIDGWERGPAGGAYLLSWSLESTPQAIPLIRRGPRSHAVPLDGDITFDVAVDVPVQSYQWFFQGKPIPGATGPAYTRSHAQPADLGQYFVRVINAAGRATDSDPAIIDISSIATLVAIDKYPGGYHTTSYDTNAVSAGSISIGLASDLFQWLGNDDANNQPADPNPCSGYWNGTKYQDVTTQFTGKLLVHTGGSSILTLLAAYHLDGDFNSFLFPIACDTTSASNHQPSQIIFNVSTGTTNTIVVAGYQGAQGNIKLNFIPGYTPLILSAPKSCTVGPGGGLILAVPANGWLPVPALQWRHNGQPMAGETNGTLSLVNFSPGQAGAYSVTCSNFAGQATVLVANVSLGGPFWLAFDWTMNGGLRITRPTGYASVLETATSLPGIWTPVATNPDPCVAFSFTNLVLPAVPVRFFRGRVFAP